MTDRTTTRVVGTLFIAATVVGIAGAVFQRSLVADDSLVKASSEENLVATGALLVLIMAAVVAIAIVLYPVLRRSSAHVSRLGGWPSGVWLGPSCTWRPA